MRIKRRPRAERSASQRHRCLLFHHVTTQWRSRMSLRRSCLTALALIGASASSALAADPPGWYASGQAGAAWQEESSTHGAMNFQSETDPGFALLGAVGRNLGNGFRLEGELGYRQIDLDRLSISNDGGAGAAAGTGSLNGITGNVSGGNHVLSFMG